MIDDLRQLGIVPIDSLVPQPADPLPRQVELPYDWECPYDRPGPAPEILNLFELETLCNGTEDAEFWQWAAVAAAKDLGVYVAWGEWRAAINHLTARRFKEWSLLEFSEAEQSICGEVNLFLKRTLEGIDMTATAKRPAKTKSAPDPRTQETKDDVLKRSLTPGDFHALKAGATDDELLVAINQAWRKPLVPGPTKYTVSTRHPTWGTAIWIDTVSQAGDPTWSTVGGLLVAVRDLLNIPFVEKPADARKFEAIKSKGKSKAKPPHPAATGTTTPAGIVANDPDANADDDDRASLGPIVKFDIGQMIHSPYQTRSEPTQEWLAELADSLKREGQLQPCLVRPNGELIGGHTRRLAALLLGWTELDVRIVECDDATARRLVLIDNAKRQDLTERARVQAYVELLADFKARGRTQAQMAEKLGIDETTLSNILRLQSLPEALWERYEAKGLSVDQIRALAVHAARPKFVAAFLGHLKNIGCHTAQPEPGHFESAFDRGISSAFRPMTRDQWGAGCQFKPTEEEKEQLEIVEIKRRYGGVQKMAANVNLWNKLNKAAKEAKKLKEAAAAAKSQDPKAQKAAAKVEAERRAERRQQALDECWHMARGMAISSRFEKPKKQDHAPAVRLRLYIAQVTGHWGDWVMDTDVLTLDDPKFMAAVCSDVCEYFKDPREMDDCDDEEITSLASWLQVDPVPHWKPSEDLLSCCTAEELQAIAEEFDLPEETTANDLVDLLVKKWPAGLMPMQFCLDKPKSPPAKKTKAH